MAVLLESGKKKTLCQRIWLIHMLAVWLGCYRRVTQCEHQGADCADAGCPLMRCAGKDELQVVGVIVWTRGMLRPKI